MKSPKKNTAKNKPHQSNAVTGNISETLLHMTKTFSRQLKFPLE